MGAAVVEEHMMEMGLIGLEGRIAFGYATEHNTEGITYGHCKDGESKGYEA